MKSEPSIPLTPVLVLVVGMVAFYALVLKPLEYQPAPPGGPPTPGKPQPQEKTRLYLFTQDGCPPCQQLHRSPQDPDVRKVLAEKFDLLEVVPPSDLFQTYHIASTPTLVAVTKFGPKSKVGYLPPAKLREWLSAL
jgi:hypothetical protein